MNSVASEGSVGVLRQQRVEYGGHSHWQVHHSLWDPPHPDVIPSVAVVKVL